MLLALKDNEVDVAQAYRRVLQRDDGDLQEGIRMRLEAHVQSTSGQYRALRARVLQNEEEQ